MDLFNRLKNQLSEIEILSLLRIYPREVFAPFDPERKENHRMLRLELLQYTELYLFTDKQGIIRIYSSLDMAIITKDTLLVYLAQDLSLDTLISTLQLPKYPPLQMPEEPFIYDEQVDLTSWILALEMIHDEDKFNFNVHASVYGDTYPLRFNGKIVNFCFPSQVHRSVRYFNQLPGLHQTIGLAQAPSIVINFDPLLALANDPEEHGYITVPIPDPTVYKHLKSYLEKSAKPFCFNCFSADDHFQLLSYLLATTVQVNPKLRLLSTNHNALKGESVIGFKSEISNLKKRGVGAELNNIFLRHLSYNEQLKKYDQKTLHLSEDQVSRSFALNTELQDGYLQVSGPHHVNYYLALINLFFGEQPIEQLGIAAR